MRRVTWTRNDIASEHLYDLSGSVINGRSPVLLLAFMFFLARYRMPGVECEVLFRAPTRSV